MLVVLNMITGWWFGTWILYFSICWLNVIIPTGKLIYFSWGLGLNHQPETIFPGWSSQDIPTDGWAVEPGSVPGSVHPGGCFGHEALDSGRGQGPWQWARQLEAQVPNQGFLWRISWYVRVEYSKTILNYIYFPSILWWSSMIQFSIFHFFLDHRKAILIWIQEICQSDGIFMVSGRRTAQLYLYTFGDAIREGMKGLTLPPVASLQGVLWFTIWLWLT